MAPLPEGGKVGICRKISPVPIPVSRFFPNLSRYNELTNAKEDGQCSARS